MNNGGGGCTGAHALPPAAAATNSSNLQVMSAGTTTTRKTKTPPSIDENETREAKKQRHHDHQQHLLGQKRKYEEDETFVEVWCVGCRENDKMFKCNYWEDPAYAKRLQRNGLERARMAAHDNQTERLLAYLESRPPYDPQQQPDPDRYYPFDLDYF